MSKRQFNNPNELLQYILDKHDVPKEIFDEVLNQERVRVHMQRRRGITKALRHIIEQNTGNDDK